MRMRAEAALRRLLTGNRWRYRAGLVLVGTGALLTGLVQPPAATTYAGTSILCLGLTVMLVRAASAAWVTHTRTGRRSGAILSVVLAGVAALIGATSMTSAMIAIGIAPVPGASATPAASQPAIARSTHGPSPTADGVSPAPTSHPSASTVATAIPPTTPPPTTTAPTWTPTPTDAPQSSTPSVGQTVYVSVNSAYGVVLVDLASRCFATDYSFISCTEVSVAQAAFATKYKCTSGYVQYPSKSHTFLAVYLTYAAGGSFTYGASDWEAYVNDVSVGLTAFTVCGPSPSLSFGQLPPGRSAVGWLVYEVPATGRVTIAYQPNGDIVFEVTLRAK